MNAVDILLRKAESMANVLETRALVAERNGKLPEETVRELSAEGLFSLVKPAAHGGKELNATAVLRDGRIKGMCGVRQRVCLNRLGRVRF